MALVMLAANAPQPKAERKQAQAATKAQNPPNRAAPIPVEVVNQPAEPRSYQDPCRGDERDRNSDLCAQWTAAEGARAAAYYARLQFWAAVGGMFGLVLTIYLTLRAVKAANASVAVARETAKRQLRAYLGCSAIDVAIDFTPNGAKFWLPQIMWQNTGQTPAYSVRAGMRWRMIETALPSNFRFPERGEAKGGLPTVAPQQSITSSWRKLTLLEIKEVAHGKKRCFIWGWAEYSDTFPDSPRRRTECAFEMRVEGLRDTYGVSFDPLQRHNAMDINCLKPAKPWPYKAEEPVQRSRLHALWSSLRGRFLVLVRRG